MTLMETAQLLGNFGEFIGAFAVVATLVYLSVQVRANSQNTQIEARQRVLDRFSDTKKLVVQSQASATLTKGTTDYASMTPEERSHFWTTMAIFADNLYNSIRLHREGVLDDVAFQYIAHAFVRTVATPGGRVWWSSEFVSDAPKKLFVEAELEDYGVVQVRDPNRFN